MDVIIPSRSRVHWMFLVLVLVSIVNVVIITQTGSILTGYNTFETEFEIDNDIRNSAASESKKNDSTNATATATATTSTTKANATSKDALPFKRYDKVVIATKIHGKRDWGLLVQSMCLLHYAYNHQVHYDIVVFTTLDDIPTPWKEELQTLITPTTLTFVVDNRGLQDEIAALPPAQYEVFLDRCNVTDPRTLTWESICPDPDFPQARPDIEQHEYDLILDETHPTLNAADCEMLPVIHGFMHITDLDFYRQPQVLNGLQTLFGNCFLCRIPDDQMAVTLPAAIYAPDKAWDLRTKGFDLRIFHNFRMDGAVPLQPPGFRRHWSEVAAMGFPTADQVCRITEAGR